MGFWTQLVMLVISVASTAYQMVQASKKKVTNPTTSDVAAQARLGFELPTEGKAEFLPKVYGKAKVGGVRVYHNTTSAFKYTSTNADRSFQTGPTSIAGGTFSRVKKDVNGNLYNEVENYASIDSGELSKDIEGTKNEFLFFQQALCQAPINGIIDVIIDESRHLDDPALGSFKAEVWSKVKAAMRIDIHNTGNVSDSIMSANFSQFSTCITIFNGRLTRKKSYWRCTFNNLCILKQPCLVFIRLSVRYKIRQRCKPIN
jgi:hypothetical protein